MLLVVADVVAEPAGDGVVSLFELDTFPRIELAKAHTWRMLFTSDGRSGVSRTAVWFVFSKLFRKKDGVVNMRRGRTMVVKRTSQHTAGKRTGRCPCRST